MRSGRLAALLLACSCGARTELGLVVAADASPKDAMGPGDAGLADVPDVSVDVPIDVGGPDSPQVCDYGPLVSDVFGTTVNWNGGAPLPAGHYRITYVDGCMKYSASQGWSVNAYASGPDTLWVVQNGSTEIAPAPGTVGFLVGQGGFASFDACVSANLAEDMPLELDFSGGTLGLRLADGPYSDNVAGESGRNPTYRLTSCP
jgi:hypothetical protein